MVLEITGVILKAFVLFFEIVSANSNNLWGLKTAVKIFLVEIHKRSEDYNTIRKEFTGKILFGLELLIIADLIETLRKPYLEELLIVGAIVIIRTLLGYFLSKEIKESVLTESWEFMGDKSDFGLFEIFLQMFKWIFEAIGTTIIIYGELRAVARMFSQEVLKKSYHLEEIRKELTNKILFGLEFYIIAAVFGTMRNPSRQELVILGVIGSSGLC
jgi:uncharacterized membrane protein